MEANNLLVKINSNGETRSIDLQQWFDHKVQTIRGYDPSLDRLNFKEQIFLQYGLDIDDQNTRTLENKRDLCNEEGLLINH